MDRESLMINKSHLDGPVPAPPSSSKKDKHLAEESSRPKKRVLETTPTPRERSPKRLRPTSPVADEQPRTLQAPTIKIPGLRSMASELANKAVGLVGEHAWDFLKRHLGYLIFYKRNIDKMEIKFGELDGMRKDVQREVETAARERLEEVKIEVQTWLDNVMKVEEEVTRIKDESTLAHANNNKGCSPHFCLHHRLGRQAAAQIQAIDDLLVKKGNFNGVYTHSRAAPSTTGSLLVNEGNYVMFYSRKLYINRILNAFKDETVHMIGVYGMGGIGKTTLVKEAANKAMKEYGLFTDLVMVTVSQNLDVKRIQTGIAESLRLELNEETIEVRADKIERRLGKERNRVLVILDDLWKRLELSKVGIPDLNKGTCTVVITTRRKEVCYQMGCKKKVELRTLSDEESWSLFNSRAEIDVVESPTMKEVAQNVAKQCAGLPLALVVLGTALKGKELKVWKIVLKQLKKSTIAVDLPDVNKEVRESIELSYNFLESEAAKWCFLHCCLYPEDYDFINEKDLMHMLVGGGLLEDVESLHEAQDRVHVLMDQLKASGLLLQGYNESYVRMHDVVRDVAIWIGERDHGFFVRAGQGLKEWPRNSTDEKKLQNIQRLSLMSNEIDGLPSDPIKCTRLETLILRNNWRLSNIPEKFFQHMGALKVLDLSDTNISCLPESLSCLTSLRVLKLEECNDISPINGLKMLEILVLKKDTREVSVVPEDTGKLPQLESVLQPFQCLPNLMGLKIKKCGLRCGLLIAYHEMEMAAADPFPKLERLVIDDCKEMSQMISSSSSPDAPLQAGMCIVFQNLRHLEVYKCPRLTHLFWSKQAKHMQQLTSLVICNRESLRAVVISNENQEEEGASASTSTSTSTTACAVVDHHHGSQYSIFPRLTKLMLYNLPQLESVLQSFQCLPNLMTLEISFCGLRCGLLIAYHEMEMAAADPFPKLERLVIGNCKKMSQMISSSSSPDAPLQAGMCIVFQNLRYLRVFGCPRLTHLFWSKQAKHMQQLIKLQISHCSSLRAVVISNEEDQEEEGASASTSTSTSTTACAVVDHHHGSQYSIFPRLKTLELYYLPKIVAFHQPSTASPMEWPCLEEHLIKECPKLETPLLGPQTSERSRDSNT